MGRAPVSCLTAALVFALAGPAPALGAEPPVSRPPAGMNAIGGSAGIPQFVAVQYERLLGPYLSLDLHAGTVIVLNSFGARLALGSTSDGLEPRLSMGVSAANMLGSFQEDPGDMKTVLFSWPGAGVAYRTAGVSAALDLGWLFATSRETGWAASSYPAASLSVMARF